MSEQLNDAADKPLGIWLEANNPVGHYTVLKIYTIQHVPTVYFLPGPESQHCARLFQELETRGLILLDKAGEPCCLSGRVPGIQRHLVNPIHGPWREEPDVPASDRGAESPSV